MTRRSVTLPPDLERAVRRLQARLLTEIDRDISFNETLNLALAAAFAVPELAVQVDRDQWSALLDGSEWQSNGTITDAGLQVLECIVPPTAAKPTRGRAPRQPREKARVAEVPPVEAVKASSPEVATPAPPRPPAPRPALSVIQPVEVQPDVSVEDSSPAIADAEVTGVEEPLVPGAPTAPLLGRFHETRSPEPVIEEPASAPTIADEESTPLSTSVREEPPVAEVDVVTPELEAPLVAEEPQSAPEAPAPSFGGGLDMEALRRAIVAGETGVDSPERGATAFGERPRDATDFASMMAGYVPAGEPRPAEEEVVVPEVELPTKGADVTPRAAANAPEDGDASDAAPEAEEPVVKPPADQAAGYQDLERALNDAAAVYEERLRNSGSS
jgi:hypothetical protein